ncbi:MAG: hypothetical protein AMXMBFR6_26270 [Betaproteobacteria bacterium]
MTHVAYAGEASVKADPWHIAASLLGGGLTAAAEQALSAAAAAYHDEALALALLERAEVLAPGHPAVRIGLYRFYFYKNRLAEALGVARSCLVDAARVLGLPADWRQARHGSTALSGYDDLLGRFYLFSLRAYGYLLLRLGQLQEGRAALAKMLELDPDDRLGAALLLGVLTRHEHGDDD